MGDEREVFRETIERACTKYSVARVGSLMSASSSAVKRWRTGESFPSTAVVEKALTLFGPTTTTTEAGASNARPDATGEEREPVSPPTSLELLDELVESSRRAFVAAMDDENASHRDRAQTGTLLRSAVHTRAKLRGEAEITLPQILRSAAWKEFEGDALDALKGYPEAAKALIEDWRTRGLM
jgi:hypothetical protein